MNTEKKSFTEYALYGLGGVALAIEFFACANNRPGDTFSAVIRRMAKVQPAIILFAGALVAHLFWPLTPGEENA